MAITLPDNENGHPCAGNLSTFQSTKVKQRLNQIDRIRAKGIGDHIPLPQLVVCGAQSAGKSSVLEGITGIPFPRQDGVCTKHATDIILRHSLENTSINASIIPHSSRDEQKAEVLRSFQRRLGGYEELPDTIKDAAACMDIRGFGVAGCDDPAFAADVLRIEVTGEICLHLTVVDLPGLISVDETHGKDVKLVENLVDSYLQSSRTIILAVVQAANDIVIEAIIQRARHFDHVWRENRWYHYQTRSHQQGNGGADCLVHQQLGPNQTEARIFSAQEPIARAASKGHNSIREEEAGYGIFSFPAVLLEDHIERELPKVCNEINTLLERTQAELHDLGEERLTIGDQRIFLSQLSMDLQGIMQAALDGSYQTPSSDFFGYGAEGASHRRLRARFHELNGLFAAYMRQRSQKRKICSPPLQMEAGETSDNKESGDQSEESEEEIKEKEDKLPDFGYPDLDKGVPQCHYVPQNIFDEWVKKQVRFASLLGRIDEFLEPGLNRKGSQKAHNGRSALSHCQSNVTRLHHEEVAESDFAALILVHKETSSCVQLALKHVIKDDQVRHEMHKIINHRLQKTLEDALAELQKLGDDEKLQPITYNHYYTDNIQQSRQDATRVVIQRALRGASADVHGVHHMSNTTSDRQRLLASLQRHVIVDMDQQTCEEAKAGLNSYYKVALKTFVDNVCRHVVERHIARGARSILTPTDALKLSDDEVQQIASETQSKQERRTELKTLKKCLQECIWELSV
ncbi:hypothetical protein LOZ65_004255 [Ophidiomyces ophidiicola]|nr:hypothetical protein LOZ65_004255 [Ophidiomyces ophidiicola]